MDIVVELEDGTEFEGARRIARLIGAHGRNMSEAALDRVLNVWDSLLKSGLARSPNKIKTAETSVDGRQYNQDAKETEIMEKSRKDALMARGRAFVKAGYTPRDAAKLALEIEQKTSQSRRAGAQSAKANQPAAQQEKHLRWGATPGAWGNDQLMVNDSAPVPPRAAQVAPKQVPHGMGPAAWGYEKRDMSKLTGHQRAALKMGVDIDRVSSAELDRMDGCKMEALARQQQLEKIAEQRNSQQVSRPVQQWGTNSGFWR